MRELPAPGDRVQVPFGLHVLDGVVRRVAETGLGVRITVDVQVDGADAPITSTYPLDAVEAASAASAS